MRYKSCYKIFLVSIVKFLVNHHRTVGYFEKTKNILQRSYVEIVYRNFYQRYFHEFLTKFDKKFFILILRIHRIQIKKFLLNLIRTHKDNINYNYYANY